MFVVGLTLIRGWMQQQAPYPRRQSLLGDCKCNKEVDANMKKQSIVCGGPFIPVLLSVVETEFFIGFLFANIRLYCI